MNRKIDRRGVWVLLLVAGVVLSGCSFKYQKRHPDDVARVGELEAQVAQLSRELDATTQTKDEEAERLRRTKEELERSLKQEIAKKDIIVQQLKKGLVITVMDAVLFDSGKAKLKEESYKTLDKVAAVLKKSVPDKDVNIEGHTDNVPIKYSGWKSNWELSNARALSVLHYFVDDKKLAPERFSASGYGEYGPVADNKTKEGRQRNRRVEIVILPELVRD